jgi:hypothetical protein
MSSGGETTRPQLKLLGYTTAGVSRLKGDGLDQSQMSEVVGEARTGHHLAISWLL